MSGGQPAWVSEEAKKQAWEERSVYGFPIGATEWEDKMKEKHAWVGAKPKYAESSQAQHIVHVEQQQPQSRAASQIGPSCMYSTQGNIVCK
jgi:hypothetical protein